MPLLYLLRERRSKDPLDQERGRCSDFDPNGKSRWLVIDRHHFTGVVGMFESDPFFAFHCVNAWDEPSTVEKGKQMSPLTSQPTKTLTS